jgi:membrane protease YdiL (CAAX protease family)
MQCENRNREKAFESSRYWRVAALHRQFRRAFAKQGASRRDSRVGLVRNYFSSPGMVGDDARCSSYDLYSAERTRDVRAYRLSGGAGDLSGRRSAMDRPTSSTFLDRFRADKILHHTGQKLVVFVIIPFGIFRFAFGYRVRDFGVQWQSFRAAVGNQLPVVLVIGLVLLAFQYFAGAGAAPIRQGKFSPRELLLGLPLCFAWLVFEVGLVEEFFFRALVQSRFAAWFKSEVSGVALMSLAFGLAHAPGFIFRQAGTIEGLGANPTVLDATAYAVVVLAVSGILFGVVWVRTKNLFALMLLHAAGDLLPNFERFINTWQI